MIRRTELLGILAIAALCVAAITSHHASALFMTGGPRDIPPRTCMSARFWSIKHAPAGKRPCVQIMRVLEDGSFRYRVSDANGTVRYEGGVGALDR